MSDHPRGRRAGNPDTRAEILAVARRHLLSGGYQRLRMRAVAAEARVDPALVSYYFGSKKGLFGAALALEANPLEALRAANAGDLATLPERILRTLVAAWDDPVRGESLRLMVNAAVHEPDLASLLRDVMQTEMIRQLADRFGGIDATARAAAFGTQLAGLIVVRYVLAIEPVASMPVDELVRFAAPGLHAAMRGPGGRPSPGQRR